MRGNCKDIERNRPAAIHQSHRIYQRVTTEILQKMSMDDVSVCAPSCYGTVGEGDGSIQQQNGTVEAPSVPANGQAPANGPGQVNPHLNELYLIIRQKPDPILIPRATQLMTAINDPTITTMVMNWVATPQSSGLPFRMQFTPPKYKGPSYQPWEEFEQMLLDFMKGMTNDEKINMLTISLESEPYEWYTTKKTEFKDKTFDQVLTEFRNHFTRNRNKDDIPGPIFMSPNEKLNMFEMRLRRHFMHMRPIPINTALSGDALKQAQEEYVRQTELHERLIIAAFKEGIYREWGMSLNNRKKQPKTLSEAVDIVKRWEDTQDRFRPGKRAELASQSIARNFSPESAHVQAPSKRSVMFETHDEPGKREITYLNRPASLAEAYPVDIHPIKHEATMIPADVTSAITNSVTDVMKELTSFVAQSQQAQQQQMKQVNEQMMTFAAMAKSNNANTSSGDGWTNLPAKLNSMMETNAKPTGKAGTRSDPTLEQLQAENEMLRNRQHDNSNNNRNNRGNSRERGNFGNREGMHCTLCNRNDHYITKCWLLDGSVLAKAAEERFANKNNSGSTNATTNYQGNRQQGEANPNSWRNTVDSAIANHGKDIAEIKSGIETLLKQAKN